MNQAAFSAIASMINGFGNSTADPDVLLKTYEAVLRDVHPQSVVDAAMRFTSGEVQGQDTRFPPTVAQFAQEAKRLAELRQYRDRQTTPAITHHRSEVSPFMVRQEQAKTKFAAWSVFKKDIGHDEFLKLSKSRAIPDGGVWSAALATVFLPPVKE